MRRRLVPLVFVVTILALGAWTGSAGAIICPAAAGASTPCCGPPTAAVDVVPGCCQTPCCQTSCCTPSTCCGGAQPAACPVISITIASGPDPSVAGQKVTIAGRLLNGGAGKTVDLWQRLPGQTSFTRVAQ